MMWFEAYWFKVLLWAILIFQLLKFYLSGRFGRFLDSASTRSLHQGDVLTGGGFVLFAPLVFFLVWQQMYLPAAMLACLTVVGLVDDIRHLSARFRLFVQLVVAVLTLYYFNFGFSLWWLFLCVALLWWLNLVNFMDGANGLVAMHGLVTMLALLLLTTSSAEINLLMVLTITSLFIYLYFNVDLKVLFMGDSGSLPLAFIIAFLSFMTLKAGTLTALQIAVMHAVLITDSSLTLAVRCYRRQRLSEAHRSHLYQRLIGDNSAHWPVSLAYAGVTAVCCTVAFAMGYVSVGVQVMCLFVVYAVLAAVFFHSRGLGR